MTELSEQELTEIEGHMRARDHLKDGTPWDEHWCDVYSELADDVPGLVAEVRRLRAMLELTRPNTFIRLYEARQLLGLEPATWLGTGDRA